MDSERDLKRILVSWGVGPDVAGAVEKMGGRTFVDLGSKEVDFNGRHRRPSKRRP